MKMMRTLILLLFVLQFTATQAQDLLKYMQSQKQIKAITEITGNPFFAHTYQIKVRQPLDYQDTCKGFFLQRVFVAEKQQTNPVVFITEGYAADYAASPKYLNELSEMLDANQICVEHRYFSQSMPDSLNWDYLTVTNAANDHHQIVQLFKPYFDGKWLNTGISKGGQTALAHRAFFPNDVDLTVAYVAPLNFGVEDGRHEPFVEKDGPETTRKAIFDFQLEVLKRRAEIVPMLKKYCEVKNLHTRMSYDEMLDYIILEYPFAFWQWGSPASEIPAPTANTQTLFDYLSLLSDPGYFTDEGSRPYQSFFVQAARELGYYGYDTKPLEAYLTIKSASGYLVKYMVPQGAKVEYNPATSLKVDAFLKAAARNVILIYGEIDPWSATAATLNNDPSNRKIVNPGDSHKTRINTLPEDVRKQLIADIRQRMSR